MKKIIAANILLIFIFSLAFSENAEEVEKYNRAVELYNQAIDEIEREKLDSAIKNLEKAISIYSEEKEFYRILGHCYFKQENYEKAVLNFREYLSFDPNDASVNGVIGQIYVYQFKDYQQALSYLRSAIQLDPENSTYRQALGYAYEQMGYLEEAAEIYKKTDQNDEWVQQRLSSTDVRAYEISVIVSVKNVGTVKIEEVNLWSTLAKSYEPQQVTELINTSPASFNFELKKDQMENPIAHFQFLDIETDGQKKAIFKYRTQIFPQKFNIPAFYLSQYNKNSEKYKFYTAPEKFVESDHPAIQEKAEDLNWLTEDGSVMIRNIYDFVRESLPYKENTETRGALYALQGGEMCDCSEFSMLFVALCRATGIPAKVVHGYTYDVKNSQKNTAHAWALVLMPNGQWIPFDPTNGKNEPNLYYAAQPGSHMGLWDYSRILQGDVASSIFYKENEGKPELELQSDYQIQQIDLWYEETEKIKEYDLDSAKTLSPNFQTKTPLLQGVVDNNKFLYAFLLFLGAPTLIFLIINPFINKKKR